MFRLFAPHHKGSQAERILARLRRSSNGLSNRDLVEMGIFSYGRRLSDLKEKGYVIESVRFKRGLWRYYLVKESR